MKNRGDGLHIKTVTPKRVNYQPGGLIKGCGDGAKAGNLSDPKVLICFEYVEFSQA